MLIPGMTPILVTAIVYVFIMGLFAFYAYMNERQTKEVIEWNQKTDIEIDANRERIIELEKRIKRLESDLNESVIESEPDFQMKERK